MEQRGESQQKQQDAQAQKYIFYRRNLLTHLSVEAFWGLGMGVASESTVLPAFLVKLQASRTTIGAFSALIWLGYSLPQLLSAYFMESVVPKKRPFILLHVLPVMCWLALAACTYFWAGGNPRLGRAILFVLYGVYTVGISTVIPVWNDFLNRLMPSRRRGRTYGLLFGFAGMSGFIGAGLAAAILSRWAFPDNFALCFLVAFAGAMLGTLCFLAIREPVTSTAVPKQKAGRYAGAVWRILKEHHAFRRFLWARALYQFSAFAGVFYIPYAMEHFGLEASSAGLYAQVAIASQTIAAPVWGWLGDKRGHRLPMIIATMLLPLATLLALVAPSATTFALVYVVMGWTYSEWLARNNLVIDMCPSEDKTTYMALMNTVLAPAAAAGPALAGVVAQMTSYRTIFWAALVLQIIAAVVFRLLVEEPRPAAEEQDTPCEGRS